MTVGDHGPYTNDDGDIWVPRTVPWRDARAVASEAVQGSYMVLRYVGKGTARLFGFSRECLCDEVCELTNEERDDHAPDLADACLVSAWHFRQDERS